MRERTFVWSKSKKDIFILECFLREEKFRCLRVSSCYKERLGNIEYESWGLDFDDLEDYHYPMIEVEKREDIKLESVCSPIFMLPVRIKVNSEDAIYKPMYNTYAYRDLVVVHFIKENYEPPKSFFDKRDSMFISIDFPRVGVFKLGRDC